MKRIGIGSVVALALAAIACGGGDKEDTGSNASNLKVSGTVENAGRSLDNASAIAIGSDGRTFSAYLDRSGKFSLDLPVGHVYRIIIANGTMSGGLHPIGHLVNSTTRGNAEEISVKTGGSMNLGRLRPAGTTSGSVHVQCGCSDDDDDSSSSSSSKNPPDNSSDSDDDYKTQQKDSDKDNLCEDSASDVDLVAENAPGDKCAKDDDDQPAPKPAPKACTDDGDKSSSSTDKSDPADDGDWDTDEPKAPSKDGSSSDEDPGSSPGKNGSSSGSSPGKDTSDSDPPSKSSGDTCSCSSQCGQNSCVAGKCTGSSTSTPSKGGK